MANALTAKVSCHRGNSAPVVTEYTHVMSIRKTPTILKIKYWDVLYEIAREAVWSFQDNGYFTLEVRGDFNVGDSRATKAG